MDNNLQLLEQNNLQNRFVQLTDQKKSEMAQTVQIELSVNSNTSRSQIKINA